MIQNLSIDKPIWEQRDLLSHSITIDVTQHEKLLVDDIIISLKDKTNICWSNDALTLAGEAYLQQSLRLSGYDLRCDDLNILPHTTQDLSQYINSYSLQLRIVSNLKFAKYRVYMFVSTKLYYMLFSEWLFGYLSSTRGYSSTVLIVALLVWINNSTYLLYALGIGYIVSNCVTLIFHEYWIHRQIKPKNRIIGFIFDYICHLFVHDRISWIYTHTYHHKHWKTPQDIEVNEMLHMRWYQYFLIASPVHGNPAHVSALEASRSELTSKLMPESQFLQNYRKIITGLTHLAVFLAFGFPIYVYFLLFQIWIFHKYIICFDELVTHYNNKTREEEVDNPYLFPICCGTAYHKSHHLLTDSIILGPGKLKYLNIQYDFIRLFYNITAKVPDKYPS